MVTESARRPVTATVLLDNVIAAAPLPRQLLTTPSEVPSQAASGKRWPAHLSRLRIALTDEIACYIDDVRPLRNQLVHNERVVCLVPATDRQQTLVHMKKTDLLHH